MFAVQGRGRLGYLQIPNTFLDLEQAKNRAASGPGPELALAANHPSPANPCLWLRVWHQALQAALDLGRGWAGPGPGEVCPLHTAALCVQRTRHLLHGD